MIFSDRSELPGSTVEKPVSIYESVINTLLPHLRSIKMDRNTNMLSRLSPFLNSRLLRPGFSPSCRVGRQRGRRPHCPRLSVPTTRMSGNAVWLTSGPCRTRFQVRSGIPDYWTSVMSFSGGLTSPMTRGGPSCWTTTTISVPPNGTTNNLNTSSIRFLKNRLIWNAEDLPSR